MSEKRFQYFEGLALIKSPPGNRVRAPEKKGFPLGRSRNTTNASGKWGGRRISLPLGPVYVPSPPSASVRKQKIKGGSGARKKLDTLSKRQWGIREPLTKASLVTGEKLLRFSIFRNRAQKRHRSTVRSRKKPWSARRFSRRSHQRLIDSPFESAFCFLCAQKCFPSQ